jgi:hypothetical protein
MVLKEGDCTSSSLIREGWGGFLISSVWIRVLQIKKGTKNKFQSPLLMYLKTFTLFVL